MKKIYILLLCLLHCNVLVYAKGGGLRSNPWKKPSRKSYSSSSSYSSTTTIQRNTDHNPQPQPITTPRNNPPQQNHTDDTKSVASTINDTESTTSTCSSLKPKGKSNSKCIIS